MEKPSEDEVIRRILRFYADQNMGYKMSFKETLMAFDLYKFFKHEEEIDLLKSKMIELKLLRSKDHRLRITNHGRDVVFKYGGWDGYLKNQGRLDSRKYWILKTEVWLPIFVSIGALLIPQIQLNDLKWELKDLNHSYDQLKWRMDSIQAQKSVKIDSSEMKTPFDTFRATH